MDATVDPADALLRDDLHRLLVVDDARRPIGVLSATYFVALAADV